jgi:hypothetical protein
VVIDSDARELKTVTRVDPITVQRNTTPTASDRMVKQGFLPSPFGREAGGEGAKRGADNPSPNPLPKGEGFGATLCRRFRRLVDRFFFAMSFM